MSTNEYKNTFNNNIDNNVAICKRRHTPVIKQFLERNKIHAMFPNKVKILSQDILSTMKQFVLTGKHVY